MDAIRNKASKKFFHRCSKKSFLWLFTVDTVSVDINAIRLLILAISLIDSWNHYLAVVRMTSPCLLGPHIPTSFNRGHALLSLVLHGILSPHHKTLNTHSRRRRHNRWDEQEFHPTIAQLGWLCTVPTREST